MDTWQSYVLFSRYLDLSVLGYLDLQFCIYLDGLPLIFGKCSNKAKVLSAAVIHFDVGSIWWIATMRNSTFVLHLADDGGLGADWWGGQVIAGGEREGSRLSLVGPAQRCRCMGCDAP